MPGPRNTLLIEGSFKELVEELADYIDNLRKSQSESAASLRTDVTQPLENYAQVEESENEDAVDGARDDVLKLVTQSSAVLNQAPERGMAQTMNPG